MINKVRVGVVGLGERGTVLLSTIMACNNGQVAAVCDFYEDRRKKATDLVKEKAGNTPTNYATFEEMLEDSTLDAILISSSWNTHVDFAVKSMRKGFPTALEVGGAYDIEACWELVRAYEETKTPFMLMENCCFDSFELLSTTLYRRGMIGEVVYCHGAYQHDLREEILGGKVNRHYRLEEYKRHNCDNYPTHELGPIAKLLNINRGNRIKTLVSVASKAVGLEAFESDERNPDKSLVGTKFAQGDIIETIMTCENGEMITMKLDTTLPSFYSREFTVRGTKGLCLQQTNMVMIEGKEEMHCSWKPNEVVEKYLNNANDYKEYLPDIWKNITDEERTKGHGGMDYLMMKTFLDKVQSGEEMPIDVYDAATWMSTTALSAQSIALNGAPVYMPDFTKGKWIVRPSKDVTKLNLD